MLRKIQYITKKPWLIRILTLVILLFPFFIGYSSLLLDHQNLVNYLPKSLVKPSSSTYHYRHQRANIAIIEQKPIVLVTGFGLGSSGSAAKPEYQDLDTNPIVTKFKQTSLDYGLTPETLPNTENWYLQLLLGGGFLYLIFYLLILKDSLTGIFAVFTRDLIDFQNSKLLLSLGMYGVVFGNSILQLWDNQTVAFIFVFVYLALVIEKTKTEELLTII